MIYVQRVKTLNFSRNETLRNIGNQQNQQIGHTQYKVENVFGEQQRFSFDELTMDSSYNTTIIFVWHVLRRELP